MTEMNGEFRHLELMKRRGRRKPSDCGEAVPKALSPAQYDIINGEVVERTYKDNFKAFEPDRALNLFEKNQEGEDDDVYRRNRRTFSEPRIGSRSGRPKVPDILSKPKMPEALLNTRSYDQDFWNTSSSVAGDTASVYSIESIADEFDGRFHIRQNQPESGRMPKWCQNAFSSTDRNGHSWDEPRRFEPPKNEPQKYFQARPPPERYAQTEDTQENKNGHPTYDYPNFNRYTSESPRFIDQSYESRRTDDQRTFVIKNEIPKLNESKYEKASSSVTQTVSYKRVW